MTVSSQTTETIIVSSGAGQTVFLFDFPLVNKNQILVYRDDVIESPSLYTVDYTVGNQGGEIVYATSPTTGSKITITRNTDVTQILAFPIAGPFPSRSHEGALDKITMILLEMSDFLITQITIITNTIIVDGTVENSTLRWNNTSETWDEFLAYLFPDADGTVNQVLVTDGAGNLSFADQTAVAATILDQILTIDTGVLDLNYTLGQSAFIDLTENVTSITFTNLLTGNLMEMEIEILQDDTTPFTIAWPASFKFPNATPPDLSTLSGTTLLHIRSRDDGTTWLATFAPEFG